MNFLRRTVVTALALALLASVAPASAEEDLMVEEAECIDMTVRLETTLTEHRYRFRAVTADGCTWSHVSDVSQIVRRSASASFSNIFQDGLSGDGCSGSDCWPVICAGTAVGSWDVSIDTDAGGGTFFQMDHGDAHLRHVNLGNGVSVLQARGLHTGTRIVTGSGTFTRTAGGCGNSFVEFSGHMVVGDPVVPQF